MQQQQQRAQRARQAQASARSGRSSRQRSGRWHGSAVASSAPRPVSATSARSEWASLHVAAANGATTAARSSSGSHCDVSQASVLLHSAAASAGA
eukprot:7155012-Prymnesium_polylepis.1